MAAARHGRHLPAIFGVLLTLALDDPAMIGSFFSKLVPLLRQY